MISPNNQQFLQKVFKSLDTLTHEFAARETTTVEFKETFNWANKDKYARTMAAFANNKGGYLIFGVSNNPRICCGLKGANFESLDEADITAFLNGLFSPEIEYEKFSHVTKGIKIGVIYTRQSEEKPVIAIKTQGSDVREGEIYYRYHGRNDKVKYPELKLLFEDVREKERKSWEALFQKISKIGASNIGILDIASGKIEGEKNSLLIDKKLIPKLKFIVEGKLADKGKPVLKLIGDVHPVVITSNSSGKAEIRITDDPSAVAVREETLLKEFPLEYSDLIKALTERYSNFKQTNHFHKIRKEICKNPKFCKTRYLDLKHQKGSKKDFYSPDVIVEFDKHYTKR